MTLPFKLRLGRRVAGLGFVRVVADRRTDEDLGFVQRVTATSWVGWRGRPEGDEPPPGGDFDPIRHRRSLELSWRQAFRAAAQVFDGVQPHGWTRQELAVRYARRADALAGADSADVEFLGGRLRARFPDRSRRELESALVEIQRRGVCDLASLARHFAARPFPVGTLRQVVEAIVAETRAHGGFPR
jgi:hypothetical protein